MNELALVQKKLESLEGLVLASMTDVQIVDKLFLYKGFHVLIYIRDQYVREHGKLFEYKYHVCDCKTIEEMNRSGRFKKYVLSTRRDGMFVVNKYDIKTDERIGETKVEKLNVCKNCLLELQYQGYLNHKKDKKIYKDFDLEAFFAHYSTKFKNKPPFTENNAPLNEYSRDFQVISYSFRAANQWFCEKCQINLEKDKEYLDTHHRNGIKWDDALDNLQCLCVACHAEQPYHDRIKETERYREFMRIYGDRH